MELGSRRGSVGFYVEHEVANTRSMDDGERDPKSGSMKMMFTSGRRYMIHKRFLVMEYQHERARMA